MVLLGVCILCGDMTGGRVIKQIDYYAVKGGGPTGDTYHWTAWGGTGGNFGGGHVYGTVNDVGSFCGGNLAVLELATLDWTTPSNSQINCVNNMTDFGGSGAVNVPAGWSDGLTFKSYNPIMVNGVLYLAINRQQQSSPWSSSMSSIIMSPDNGLHWCNPATVASYGGCTPAHWSANGDAPPNATTGMMWGTAGVYTNTMARLMFVQYSKDQATTGMPDGADNYVYGVGRIGNGANMIAFCVAKSDLPLLNAANFRYYTGGNSTCGNASSWSATQAAAIEIMPSGSDYRAMGNAGGIVWLPEFRMYVMAANTGNDGIYLAKAYHPWGPWKVLYGTGSLTYGSRQASILLPTYTSSCSGCSPGVRGQIVVGGAMTGHSPSLTPTFSLVDLQVAGTDGLGNRQTGQTRLRYSLSNEAGTLPRRGLIWAFDLADHLLWGNISPSYYTNTYQNELTGTGACLTTVTNPVGYSLYGVTNVTSSTTLDATGVRTSGNYISHLLSKTNGASSCNTNFPLTGNPTMTLQVVFRPENVTANGQGIIMLGTDLGTAHQRFEVGTNQGWENGTHLGVVDGGGAQWRADMTGLWGANKWYLLTVIKRPGPTNAANVDVYLGATKVTGSTIGTANGDTNLAAGPLHLGCAAYVANACDGTAGTAWTIPATWAYFAAYSRELTFEEIARSYGALKAALAKAPRNIALQ